MAGQPTGTVTLLFSDIEGSTTVLHRVGSERYARALDLHRRLMRETFERHGGYEVDCEGDAFFVSFASASEAVAAAAEAQQALAGAEWPEQSAIRVRMGIHTGEPLAVPPRYVGIDVHKAARIMAAGHGGQVLVSQTTCDLVEAELRDLGDYRLKDLSAPQRLYQLGEAEFPPLKSLGQSNLPVQPLPLIGRGRELREVLDLSSRSPLLTLTGAGGSGKTRLALQAAAEMVDDHADGVWFVSLASLDDPALVESAIARAVGADEELGRFLAHKQLLLLLDNLEQLLPGVATVVARLLDAPGVRVLATSRERLAVSAEQEYPVPTLTEEDALDLFTARAQRLKPAFEPDEAAQEIARRLDGLPLAIELAAARVNVLTPAQILERLGRSLDLLTAGARDAPERQQTLRATIEWSHDLLTPAEQLLFARLGVFAASFDLEAAEAVAAADLDTLAALVDKNLLRQTEDGRFFMLETIHEFAVEQLEASGGDAIRDRHADYAVEEVAEPPRGERPAWIESIGRSYGDFRAALEWLRETDAEGRFTTLVCRLAVYWDMVADVSEARRWIMPMLSASSAVTAERIHARNLLTQAVRLQGALGEARAQNDLAQAEATELGDLYQLADAKSHRGAIEFVDQQFEKARTSYDEAITLLEQIDDHGLIPIMRHDLGLIALTEGDLPRARAVLEQVLEDAVHAGQSSLQAAALGSIGFVAVSEGQPDQALAWFREALRRYIEAYGRDAVLEGPAGSVALDAYGIAAALSARGEVERARILVAALDAHLARIGAVPEPYAARAREDVISAAADRLAPSAVEAACTTGAALPFGQAITEALSLGDPIANEIAHNALP
jgi:predicted ATPase/class 3 adenylate cyclase